jgi:hypothetical protein
MSYGFLRGLLVAVVVVLFGSSAFAEGWTVARVTGTAWLLQQGGAPVQVAAGMQVPLGATVATTPQGRAMLVHGRDTMIVGPSTKIAIPYKPDRGMQTTVIQQVGQVDLAVEKRGRPHFSVQTPFLAAVVKGTEFTVTVSADGAGVGVKGGLVSVADLRTGERAEVGSGQRAAVSLGHNGGLQVSGVGVAPQVRAGRTQKATVPSVRQAAVQDNAGTVATHGADGGQAAKGSSHASDTGGGTGGGEGRGADTGGPDSEPGDDRGGKPDDNGGGDNGGGKPDDNGGGDNGGGKPDDNGGGDNGGGKPDDNGGGNDNSGAGDDDSGGDSGKGGEGSGKD